MITELKLMQLASGQEKVQVHEHPLFPCSAYYTNWRRGQIEGVPWHWHAELEFMVVEEGAAWAEFDTHSARLMSGDGYFCNSKVLHRINMTDCDQCRVNSFVVDARLLSGGEGTVFDRRYVRPVLAAASFPGMALTARDAGCGEILAHIRAACEACRNEPFGYEYEVRYHLGKALCLIQQASGDALKKSPDRVDADRERTQRMLDCVHDNYAEKLTVSDLARAAGICEREVQRCFQRVLKQSPLDYIQVYRLQMASQLLLDTDMSVLDVGMACGFANPSHFSRVFREHTGRTPRDYRRALAGGG